MQNKDITDPFLVRLKERIDNDPKLSAASLSVKAGLSNAAIRHWMNGDSKGPTLENARKVAEALGTSLEEFLSNAESEEERRIVRLVSQLPESLRERLLGYGEGLLATVDREPQEAPQEEKPPDEHQ